MEMSVFGETDKPSRFNHLDPGYAIDPTSLVLNTSGVAQPSTVNREIFQAQYPDDSNVGYSGGALQQSPSWLNGLLTTAETAAKAGLQQQVQKVLNPQTQQYQYIPVQNTSSNSTIYLVVGFIVVFALVITVLIARK